MSGKILTTIVLLSILIAQVGCGAKPTSTPEPVAPSAQAVLKISGSGTTTSVLGAVKPAFEADTPGYRLETLAGSDTGGGVKGVIEGILDVAAMSRPPKEEEPAQIEFVSLGFGPEIPIAHAAVGVTSVTRQELTAIFSGEITNWSQVGGPDLGIIVYVRGADTTHTKAVREHLFGDTPFVEEAQVMGSLDDMIAAVEGTPGSVGYANWPGVITGGANVRAIAVDGVGPSDSTYPAVLELGVGYLPERQTDVQPLIDWLLSETGQAALREFGVITN